MDNFYTIMFIPDREKDVKSYRIPKIIFKALGFGLAVTVVLIGILVYDYSKILQEVHRNRHLSIENRQLKEQIQRFQVSINSLSENIERIQIFEKKLRLITGMDDYDLTKSLKQNKNGTSSELEDKLDSDEGIKPINQEQDQDQTLFLDLKHLDNYEDSFKYKNLKNLYEQKIATNFGLQSGYKYTKVWSDLIKNSFSLARDYAEFDYKYSILKEHTEKLEVEIHGLDQYILDKKSFLRSTPSLLPTQGWITSYYGPRMSHYSNRIKMHEGIDIGAKPGAPITAPADGIVTYSGNKPGFGKFVKLDHGYGIETIYAHASKLVVKKGQKVNRGQTLAKIGSTGYSTGPHVHYEVRINGTPVDPLYYILD